MKISKLLLFFLTLTFFIVTIGHAQKRDIATQEDKFVKLYSKLFSFAQQDYDSTSLYSERFIGMFVRYINSNPATLRYPFKKLIDSNFCNIVTSSDGNFRIYSWDTWTGGTMHSFFSFYQWQSDGKIYTKNISYTEADPGSFCSKIFTVPINDIVYYLAVTNSIYSTKDGDQTVTAYTIDHNRLIDTVKLFRTRKQNLNKISVDFDFFSVVDLPERPLELITYDDRQKILYIPVVGDKGAVTKRNILYQLKGSYFEFIGVESGKRK